MNSPPPNCSTTFLTFLTMIAGNRGKRTKNVAVAVLVLGQTSEHLRGAVAASHQVSNIGARVSTV